MSGVRKIASSAVEMGSAARPLRPVHTPTANAPDASTHALEEVYKQAYLEGFAAGEEDGRKEAQRQASESLTHLERSLAEAEDAKRSWQEGLREAVEQFTHATAMQTEAVEHLAAKLAEIAVRRIVGRLHTDHRAVQAICRETLHALQLDSAQVRVCPSDAEAVAELPPGIELIADASLARGACLVRSPQGDIDAGLATQLMQLHDALEAALTEERA